MLGQIHRTHATPTELPFDDIPSKNVTFGQHDDLPLSTPRARTHQRARYYRRSAGSCKGRPENTETVADSRPTELSTHRPLTQH
ncbi:hypothetical protein NSERUTF1_6445 [Nocardia seriolae]|nr:hypothetical protein NSERUTF1_6445 [Nocardia seriolae]